jgi:hypothetical protein
MLVPVKFYMAGGKQTWVVIDKILIGEVHLRIAAIPVYLSESVNEVCGTSLSPYSTCWIRMHVRSRSLPSSLPNLFDYIPVNSNFAVQTPVTVMDRLSRVLSSLPVDEKVGSLLRAVRWIRRGWRSDRFYIKTPGRGGHVRAGDAVVAKPESRYRCISRGICKAQSILPAD